MTALPSASKNVGGNSERTREWLTQLSIYRLIVMIRTLLRVVSQLLTVFLWNAVLPVTVAGPSVHHCTRHSDCNTSAGQQCYRLYDGCTLGRCMCDLKLHRMDDTGRCVRLKNGGDRCSLEYGDICRTGMVCREGICSCKFGKMSADGEYCIKESERLLGEPCTAPQHSCLHYGRDGYTRNDINCTHRAKCECLDGYKADGVSCRRWNIGEYGCRVSHQCSGGALCIEGRCVCPPDYQTTADGSKCTRVGAEVNVQFGAKCDEINETSYCNQGLICHRCPLEAGFKCVKFLMTSEFAFLTGATVSRAVYISLPLTLLGLTSTQYILIFRISR